MEPLKPLEPLAPLAPLKPLDSLGKVTEEPKSIFSSIGGFAKEVALSIPRALTAATLAPLEYGLTGKQGPLGDFAFRDTEKGSKEQLAAGAGAIIDIGSVLIGGSAATTLAKNIVARGGVATMKTIAKEAVTAGGAKVVAKNALIDFGLGAGFGVTSTAMMDPDATVKDYAYSAIVSGLISTAIPPTFEIGVRGGKLLMGGISDTVSNSLEKYATKLESSVAAKRAPTVLEDFKFQNIQPVKADTFQTQVEEAVASGIRKLQDVPDLVARAVYMQAKLKSTLEKVGKLPEKEVSEIVQGFQRLNAVGAQKGVKAINALYEIIDGVGGIEPFEDVKQVLTFMDNFDRVKLGNTLQDNLTGEQLALNWMKFRSLINTTQGKGALEKLEAAARDVNRFNHAFLKEELALGMISKADYERILMAHPNYIPHSIIDYQIKKHEGGAVSSGTRSLGKLKRATGSARTQEDPLIAQIRTITSETYRIERQRAENAFFKAARPHFEDMNITPVITVQDHMSKEALIARGAELKHTATTIEKQVVQQRAQLKQIREKIDDLKKRPLRPGMHKDTVEQLERIYKRHEDEMVRASHLDKELVSLNKVADDLEEEARVMATRDFEENKGFIAEAGRLFKRVESLDDTIKGRADKLVERGMNLDQLETQIKAVKDGQADKVNAYLAKRKADTTAGEMSSLFTKGEIAAKKAELNTIRAEKKEIYEALKEINAKKVQAVDVPEGMTRFKHLEGGYMTEYLMPTDLVNSINGVGSAAAQKAVQWLNGGTLLSRLVTGPGKVLRGVATQYNPAFLFGSNVIRDMQGAKVMSNFTMKNYTDALYEILGKKAPEHLNLFREGGVMQTSFLRAEDSPRDIILKTLQKKGVMGKTLSDKLLTPLHAIEAAGEVIEEATRLAVFKNALARPGYTVSMAVEEAANASVDFGRHGDLTQLINQVVPYFNAGVQGTLGLARYIGKNPQDFARKSMAMVVVPTTALYAWNSQYTSFQGVPDTDRQLNWIIMVGQTEGRDPTGKKILTPNYIKIPKGVPQMSMAFPLERTFDNLRDTEPDTLKEFLGGWVDLALPIDFTGAGAVGGFIPAGPKMLIEQSTNYSFFRDRPIVGQWVKQDGKWYKTAELEEGSQFSDLTTSELSQIIGKALNYSPQKLDYMIRTGVLNDLVLMTDLPFKMDGTESNFEKAAKVPLFRKFIGTNGYQETVDDTKKELEEAKKANEIKIERRKLLEKKKSGSAGSTLPPLPPLKPL